MQVVLMTAPSRQCTEVDDEWCAETLSLSIIHFTATATSTTLAGIQASD